MIHQLFDIPYTQKFIFACSGGVDSMAVADFYHRGMKLFHLAYFHHGTPQADKMLEVVREYASQRQISLLVGTLTGNRKKTESPEEFWRNERYNWLLSQHLPVVTAHHLDDVVETWVFSSLHGNPKIIYPKTGNVWRPFLLNEKRKFVGWCERRRVTWVEDESNRDIRYPRNRIRHVIVPECLKINPGLHKVIKKKILASVDS
jgi:tRNA(Ile)-lysidine synthase